MWKCIGTRIFILEITLQKKLEKDLGFSSKSITISSSILKLDFILFNEVILLKNPGEIDDEKLD